MLFTQLFKDYPNKTYQLLIKLDIRSSIQLKFLFASETMDRIG